MAEKMLDMHDVNDRRGREMLAIMDALASDELTAAVYAYMDARTIAAGWPACGWRV